MVRFRAKDLKYPAMLVACLLFHSAAVVPTNAQWPTTEWHVRFDAETQTRHNVEEVNLETGVGAFIKQELEGASEWLEQLGFPEPVLETTRGSDGQVLLAWISDIANLDDKGQRDKIGHYDPNLDRIYLVSDHFFAMGSGPTEKEALREMAMDMLGTANPVHELFHAIQEHYNQNPSQGVPPVYVDDAKERDPRAWIVEGTADAVAIAWLLKRDPEIKMMSDRPRSYDHPLHVPASDRDDYGTRTFWRGLGKMLGSEHGIAYLDEIYSQDLEPHLGLEGVDKALRAYHSEGLSHFYTSFIARYARQTLFFETYDEIRLEYREPEDKFRHEAPQTVREVAANAHQLEVFVPAGKSALLEIWLQDAAGQEPAHEDLRLVVDDQRLDVTAPSTAISETEWDLAGQQFQPSGKGRRNRFETVLTGSGEDREFFIRVVNVAGTAYESEEQSYRLAASLVPVEPCSKGAMIAALNLRLPPVQMMVQQPAVVEEGETDFHPRGGGRLEFRGLVQAGGATCTSHIAALDHVGAAITGGPGGGAAAAVMKERGEKIKAKVEELNLDQLGKQDSDMTPAEKAAAMEGLMELTGEISEIMKPADDDAEEVIIRVLSPHLLNYQTGSTNPPLITEHSGMFGWPANAAAHLILHLPGTTPSGIKEGDTYPVQALAPDEPADNGSFASLPTVGGFLTRWEGELKEGKFVGTTWVLLGELTGQLTVEHIGGQTVRGTFVLEGNGILEEEIHEPIYDSSGRIRRTNKEVNRTEGPVAVQGSFTAPNHTRGRPGILGHSTVVIE